MKQLHTDPTTPQGDPDPTSAESLSAYVKRMETPENLEKLARKLSRKAKQAPREQPDLSFEKFENKQKQGGQ